MIKPSVKCTVYSEADESIPVSAFHERKQLNYEQETCPPAAASTTGERVELFVFLIYFMHISMPK